MHLSIDLNTLAGYERFLAVKSLPAYRFVGRTAIVPDHYADRLGVAAPATRQVTRTEPLPGLYDYQQAILTMAILKRKFSLFVQCGLGKTRIFLEWARHVANVLPPNRSILIVSPLMVISQTLAECKRWCGESLPIVRLRAAELAEWMISGDARIGITNYEALKEDTPPGRLGALILDESAMLKSHYGKWGKVCLRLGRGLNWKLCATGTPAPNDRIEYANHAVFMDASPSVNAFLARYFVNRGQTQNRWELKPHALRPFYRSLSHWCIFLENPATYGWRDNSVEIPPIHTHIHDVPMTEEQRRLVHRHTGQLFVNELGGITSRAAMAQVAKGWYGKQRVQTNKYTYIDNLIGGWPEESTIIWCLYNREQELLEQQFPEAGSIKGSTPPEQREDTVNAFKNGESGILISKPRILGFGLNLHRATRQVFSGLQDSFEAFHQAVKRSNRIGSTRPLNVHIPVTDMERPMIDTVLRKADRVQRDTEEQERMFCDAANR